MISFPSHQEWASMTTLTTSTEICIRGSRLYGKAKQIKDIQIKKEEVNYPYL